MEITSDLLNAIFGQNSYGATAEERAETSSQVFVRSTHELSFFYPESSAKGTTFTAKQALNLFGIERLVEIVEDGSAILTRNTKEPFSTLRRRREEIGLSEQLVARLAGIKDKDVFEAENPLVRPRIRVIGKIARVLGIDENKLCLIPGGGADPNLGIRLKSWQGTQGGLPARTIASFLEASWVIHTQNELQKALEPSFNRPDAFSPESDYNYPVYVIADRLAHITRRALGYNEAIPIQSLRDLCHRLRIPLIRIELARWIAGATIETNGVRGIIVNTQGPNENVWVQRATVAHELGHLLWDPTQQLNSLLVDRYQQFDRWERRENDQSDYVEARANAFAVELLAPKAALRERFGALPVSCDTLRAAMEEYGLSRSAMSWHLYNATERQHHFPTHGTDTEPTDEWRGQEQYTADFFPISTVPQSRRGSFCAYVVRAQRSGWLTERTAADYLMTDEVTYRAKAQEILDLFPDV